MFVKDYEFGRITVNGRSYSKDVIIFPDRVLEPWWRKDGHVLAPEDLTEVVREKPHALIIGTGRSGLMKVPAETIIYLKTHGIEVFSYRTADAVKLYNSTPKCHKIIMALHLTC